MRVPTVSPGHVYHLGTMDPADLGRNSPGGSQEGRCLSVSLCPNSWEAIASLGGNGLHRLARDGASFLDVHAAMSDAELRAEVLAWASREGMAETATRWRAWYFDEESEDWRSFLVATRQDAVEEVESATMLEFGEDEIPAPDGMDGPIEEVVSVVATPRLLEVTGMKLGPNDGAVDAVFMAWAIEELPRHGIELDGVWWNEDHDPDILSSPRGGVFPDRVAEWSVEAAELDDVDDDEELCGMPETEWIDLSAAPTP
jgi:hypothetical protein